MNAFNRLCCRSFTAARNDNAAAIEAFRTLVSEQSSCRPVYRGWPPPDRIPVGNGTLEPLGRSIFIMRRDLKDGLRSEPTLVLCCGTKPMLMLRRSEFEALVQRLPWIKDQLREFYKLI
ncbi:hypothetical protein BBOV_III006825 [Babesia bovis T2Bo]|uniref:hypothetical protein n=1 Tax=Babesia bovis T2Bo TaxID=484906 RepID=UPI001C354489|nr:hypothetical protein BBOV_III006825 [Babesia bovis T2Bo]KAG6440012.1 hypothetical protein BBOV_III006825 [Babesia bovis T2Bo]